MRYATVTLADIGNADLRVTSTDYLQRFEEAAAQGVGPVFLGRAREYKTVAAVALAKAIWSTFRVPVDFMACGQLLAMDLDRYSEETRKRLHRWETVPVLVVDDFAAVEPGSFGAGVVRHVCAARFDGRWPTIWTGNLKLRPGAEFECVAGLFGPLFARRLEDGGKGFTVLID